MEHREIAFVDLAQRCTSVCSQVAPVLRDAFPRHNIRRYSMCPDPPSGDPPPRVLIMRERKDMFSRSLEELPDAWAEVPVFALCCHGWSQAGAELDSLGAVVDDFATCPVRVPELVIRVKRLLENRVRAAEPRKRTPLDGLIGASASFVRVLSRLSLMARSDASVVLSGATGTGKELFARAIHYMSPRMGHPFIPVNCGSVPDHLLENELFGHVRGAYTDARAEAPGLVKAAEGGTLFLDEVDALTPSAQIKLLRFLQDHEYRPLGSATAVTASIRIVAASNADLMECVRARTFREDLYHRLHVLWLRIPALRERMDDVPRLAEHFLNVFARQERREPRRLTMEAVQKLMGYDWPGNVRQLEAVIQRAVILSAGPQIEADDISLPEDAEAPLPAAMCLREAKARAIEQFERAYLSAVMSVHHGNLSRAARQAGKERRSFQRLLQKHNLARESFE
jgi:DNA-binding NtrC family response regulator